MRNVQIMNLLSHDSFRVNFILFQLFYFFRGAIPVFENLLHLSITTMSECCWRGLVFLLNNCPNLETLTIKGTFYYDTYSSVCECLSGYFFPQVMSCESQLRPNAVSRSSSSHPLHFRTNFDCPPSGTRSLFPT
ncbi:unnamed protein product [Brassica oleracea var. botrytis]|uniref:(rape) hypothetical protein n=1 Tax=Brassica napus TaxID=3708 RepID=A0A816IBW4_BRANA|nr:unnamed protein product [Brassica napus]